jgi:hypothetical protein
MAVAMFFPEPAKLKRKGSSDSEHQGFSKARLSQARQVLRYSRTLAEAVAMLYPEPDKRGRGNKGKAAESAGFSQRRLREARQVLRYSL